MALVNLFRLSIHAGLPWVLGHLGHGDYKEGNPAEEEEDEGYAGADEGPGVVVLNPDSLLALNHPYNRLPHHLHRNDGTYTCGRNEGSERKEM